MTVDRNNEDQPLSSEELLRQAREGLGESESKPLPEDFSVESYPPPATRDYEVSDYEVSADDEPEIEMPEPESVADRYDYPPPTPEPSGDGVGSWAPPPVDTGDSTPWASGPAPEPAQTSRRRFSLGTIIGVIVLIGVVGAFMINLFDSSKTVDEIAVGDCMDIPEDDEFSTIDPIDCTEPHDLEIFAVLDMSTQSSLFSVAAPYPGDMELYEASLDACLEPFEPYVGSEYELSKLWIDAFTPTVEGWEEFDDREVQCVLLQLNDDLTDVVKSDRSFRNSGL